MMFPSLKIFFLQKLLLFGVVLEDHEYDLINESVEEGGFMTLDVLRRLLDIGKFVYREGILDFLLRIKGSEEVVQLIQDKFLMEISSPVMHLCSINEQSMSIVRKLGFEETERYFLRYINEQSVVQIDDGILIKYLEHPKLGTTFFLKAIDMKAVNYSLVMNHAYKNAINTTFLRNLVMYAYTKAVDSLLPDIIKGIHEGPEDICLEYLCIVGLIVLKNRLDREELRQVFDELLYLDRDRRVRTTVLEILGEIIMQFKFLDRFIKKSNNMKVCSEENAIDGCGCVIDIPKERDRTSMIENYDVCERLSEKDYKTINSSNSNVLAAKIWPEIREIIKEGELDSILGFLLKVIEATESFYSERIQSSGYLKGLINFYDKKRLNRRSNEKFSMYFKFIELSAKYFKLTKPSFESIFGVAREFHDVYDMVEICKNLFRQDKYFLFYLHTTYNSDNKNFSMCVKSIFLNLESQIHS